MSLILSFRRRKSSVRLSKHHTKPVYCYTWNTRIWVHEYERLTTKLHAQPAILRGYHMLAVQPATEQ